MTPKSVEENWQRLIERLGRGDRGTDVRLVDDLDDLQHRLQHEIFGETPTFAELRPDVASDDRRLAIVLDALEALSLLEPADASYPWERGSLLYKVGRHLEAAADDLIVARRLEQEAADGAGQTGDEQDWARSALFHAARNLALGGQPASATALLEDLDPEDRAEVVALLAARADAA